MKKLLIMLLVLGLVSSASAAISFDQSTYTVLEGNAVTLDVSSDEDLTAYLAYIDYTDDTSLSTSCISLAAAGPDRSVTPNPYGYAGYYEIVALDNDVDNLPAITAGTHFQFTITTSVGDNLESYTINLLGNDWATVVDTATVNVTPEPMTIALLGLGGLFLRRRK